LSWSYLTEWWLAELAIDSAYEEVVTPLLLEVLQPGRGAIYLDMGCGEGRVMRVVTEFGAVIHGLDINPDLAARASPTMVADLLAIPVRDATYDGVYSVLTLEHVADHDQYFAEAGRVTKPDGVLALVINHPVWTAPDSTPISDADGEVLWRPGDYFSNGLSEVPAGESTVMFQHRSMADLLNAASVAGWSLEHVIERPHHEFEDQSGIPRLLACRWRLLA
jgi:SAM-dependent methyltransferase